MEIFHSLILGLIQGLAEFLPISSTAHLVIVPYLFHWPDPGLSFDVAVHIGTLIAVVLFFWRDWLDIFKMAFLKGSGQKIRTYSKNLLGLLIIATIPGVLAGYFFESKAETVFRSPLLIASALIFIGFILYLADKYAQRRKDLNNINFLNSFLIGLSQAVAIIPGVSRSGATITTGLFCGLDRISAAKFSFLLSTPIILGAAVFKFPEFIKSGINLPEIIAILSATVSGYLAIKYLIKFIEKASYRIFFWYRLGLGILIIFVYIFLR